jgi:hypothetical protein
MCCRPPSGTGGCGRCMSEPKSWTARTLPPRLLQDRLAHATVAMTMRYSHVSAHMQRGAATRVEELLSDSEGNIGNIKRDNVSNRDPTSLVALRIFSRRGSRSSSTGDGSARPLSCCLVLCHAANSARPPPSVVSHVIQFSAVRDKIGTRKDQRPAGLDCLYQAPPLMAVNEAGGKREERQSALLERNTIV